MVGAEHVKEGAVVVDVGIHRNEEGGLVGDVRFDEVEPKAAWISPVPGGVGPMTRAMLLHNTVTAARMDSRVRAVREPPTYEPVSTCRGGSRTSRIRNA